MVNQDQRIQRRRKAGWKKPEGVVYIGRPSVFGNPLALIFQNAGSKTRLWLVEEFRRWLYGLPDAQRDDLKEYRARLISRLHELTGATVMCWCRTDDHCHGDVLIEVANDPDKLATLQRGGVVGL